ncbi:MAG: hypothetical protein GTO41_17800 [Burkholderiales bacterium]|nr:hypothetical protein [Burkholderiales bacterium]
MNKSAPFLAMLLALISHAAVAHTQLSTSIPADKAVLSTAPHQVELQFSEPVRLTGLSIEKQGGAVQHLEASPAATSTDFSAVTSSLDMGSYVVRWRAVGADTHVISGEFGFTVSPEGATTHTGVHSAAGSEAHSQTHSETHSDGRSEGHVPAHH